MHKELLARGIRVGRERVRRLMQQHGIRAKTQHKFVVTTDSRHSPAGGPGPGTATFQSRYTRPALVWQHHLIATDEGWVYLAAVIDLFSRQVVGWSMQAHNY